MPWKLRSLASTYVVYIRALDGGHGSQSHTLVLPPSRTVVASAEVTHSSRAWSSTVSTGDLTCSRQ